MHISVFDIFSIGVGPSSSHTVGPMKAAFRFANTLHTRFLIEKTTKLNIELFGSLAMTGVGHCTDRAIIMGLEDNLPDNVDPSEMEHSVARVKRDKKLRLFGRKTIDFNYFKDLHFRRHKKLPYHSNAMRIEAFDESGKQLYSQIFYSIGGGFILDHQEALKEEKHIPQHVDIPYPFKTCKELLSYVDVTGKRIDEIVLANERVWRSDREIESSLLEIWNVMKSCVIRGCSTSGYLPGELKVERRAYQLYKDLQKTSSFENDPALVMDWVSLWAMAVNEENAAGGRIVTSPTNGAAGIVPAVLHYYEKFIPGANQEGICRFLLTAAGICILYKEGASISGAEMGCQGEVGVACSIAAAGLTAALTGSARQIENAAEIGMEHNLGLTCDPVAGLVQIPCIERNTMGAIKAINASRLALRGNESYKVSLDDVIYVMRQVGDDMKEIYKETSEGGLAAQINVGVPSC